MKLNRTENIVVWLFALLIAALVFLGLLFMGILSPRVGINAWGAVFGGVAAGIAFRGIVIILFSREKGDDHNP